MKKLVLIVSPIVKMNQKTRENLQEDSSEINTLLGEVAPPNKQPGRHTTYVLELAHTHTIQPSEDLHVLKSLINTLNILNVYLERKNQHIIIRGTNLGTGIS